MPEAQSNNNAKEEKDTASSGNIWSNDNHVSSSYDNDGDNGITELAEIVTMRCVSNIQCQYQPGNELKNKWVKSFNSDLEKEALIDCTSEIEFESDIFER